MTPAVPSFGPRPIVIGEQHTNQVVVLDQTVEDWSSDAAVVWRWPLPAIWGAPGDIKRRRSDERLGGDVLLVVTLKNVAVVQLDNLRVCWQVSFPRGVSSHTAEILPSGLVAVAGTGGNWIRVYSSAASQAEAVYAEQAIDSPHGLQWDPEQNLLWGLGGDRLIAMTVSSVRGVPRIFVEHTVILPVEYPHGHDLTASRHDHDILWLSTQTGVLQYVKSTDQLTDSYTGHEVISQCDVKAVGDWPDGQVVFNHPTSGSLHPWTTNTDRFFGPTATRTRSAAAFYKARPFVASYQ